MVGEEEEEEGRKVLSISVFLLQLHQQGLG
jgi:hypothetical protein